MESSMAGLRTRSFAKVATELWHHVTIFASTVAQRDNKAKQAGDSLHEPLFATLNVYG
jgi:hypothetical protein